MGTPVELRLPGRAAHHGETLLSVAGTQNTLPSVKEFGISPVREAKSKYAISYQGFNCKQILS